MQPPINSGLITFILLNCLIDHTVMHACEQIINKCHTQVPAFINYNKLEMFYSEDDLK